MAETQLFTFTYKELAEMMVRKAGINEGLWGVTMRLGIQGVNVGSTPEDMVPAALVPILQVGVQRFDEPSSLTVDAAEIAGTHAAKSAKPSRRGARTPTA